MSARFLRHPGRTHSLNSNSSLASACAYEPVRRPGRAVGGGMPSRPLSAPPVRGNRSCYEITGLGLLIQEYGAQNLDRYKFRHRHGRATFDVLFFTDTRPFELLFGCLGANFAMTIKVRTGFVIDPYLDRETYRGLCRVLGLTPDPNNPLSTGAFFAEFDEGVPRRATPAGVPRPHEVAVYRRDVEEADKIYFCAWRNNEARART
jgi:hypothetical protein